MQTKFPIRIRRTASHYSIPEGIKFSSLNRPLLAGIAAVEPKKIMRKSKSRAVIFYAFILDWNSLHCAFIISLFLLR